LKHGTTVYLLIGGRDMTVSVVPAGSFCWNPTCPEYANVGQDTLRKFGFTRKGVQRLQCKRCKKVVAATKGTVFYGSQHTPETIVECLALMAERNSLASIHRTKGIKEETLTAWMHKTARQCEGIEAALLSGYQPESVQMDALWTLVTRKGTRGGAPRNPNVVTSGAARR
jgi:transposase-like protein